MCADFAPYSRQFKLTAGAEELIFNQRAQLDTIFLSSGQVIYMLDESAPYCAALFLRNQSTSNILRSLLKIWSLLFIGCQYFLMVDPSWPYTSKKMRKKVGAFGVRLEEAPIEARCVIGLVERYYHSLRFTYEPIWADNIRPTSGKECLQLAVFAVDHTVRQEGVCTVLIVFRGH